MAHSGTLDLLTLRSIIIIGILDADFHKFSFSLKITFMIIADWTKITQFLFLILISFILCRRSQNYFQSTSDSLNFHKLSFSYRTIFRISIIKRRKVTGVIDGRHFVFFFSFTFTQFTLQSFKAGRRDANSEIAAINPFSLKSFNFYNT